MRWSYLVLGSLAGCLVPEKHLTGWNTPTRLSISIPGADDHPTLTDDLLEMYFARSSDIYVTKRARADLDWTDPGKVPELSTDAKETAPEVSPDGLTIYFASDSTIGSAGNPSAGMIDIWVATRSTRSEPWRAPSRVDSLDTAQNDKNATPLGDSNVIVLASDRDGHGYDLYTSSKQGAGPWAPPIPIANQNTPFKEAGPILSADQLTLYFYSDRAATHTDDLYQATRLNKDLEFSPPTLIDQLSSPDKQEANPWVAPGGQYIVFSRDNTLYEATRTELP